MSASPISHNISSSTTVPRIRLDAIDALRGIAALMVAGYHIWGHYGVYPFPSLGVVPWTKSAGLLAYLVSPLRWGYLGVGLFLVLSGFCIHLPFARKREQAGSYKFEWRKFYLRRLWRLYPAYAASVIGTFILLLFVAHWSNFIGAAPSVSDLLAHLTLMHGYFDRYFYGIVDVYWSLALEFQLYLAYPIFLYLFRRIGISRSIVFLTIFSLLWRLISMNVFHSQLISVAWTGPYAMMGCIFARMPEWLFGAWLAEWFVRSQAGTSAPRENAPRENSKRLMLASAGAVVLFTAMLSTLAQSLWVFTDSLFGLGFALVIAAAIIPAKDHPPAPSYSASLHRRGSPFYRLLIWAGTISYSLYLFHMQFSWFANPWIREIHSPALQFALRTAVFLISIPLIAYIFRLVEAPFLSPPHSGKKLFTLYQRIGRSLGIKSDAPIVVQLESVST